MDAHRLMIRIVTASCLLFAGQSALACSCIEFSTEDAVRSSPNVFIGTVTTETVEGRQVVSSLKVQEVLRGDESSTRVVHTSKNTAACGFGQLGVGSRLLFMTGNDGSFGLCSGTTPLNTPLTSQDEQMLARARAAARALVLEEQASVLKYTQSISKTRHHLIHASNLERDFHLLVKPPTGYTTSGERYPVVYLLDGGALFPMLAGYYNYLRLEEALPDMIVVGISYGADSFEEGNLRSTDYTAPSSEREYYGGAQKFQQLLEEQVLRFVDSRYHADPARRYLFGQSIGGQFVIYSAMTKPGLFAGHIASNPALHRNLEFFLEPKRAPGQLSELIVLRAGQDDKRFSIPSSKWVAYWEQHLTELPVVLETHVIDGYGHFSLAPEAFRRGLALLLADRSG